MWVIIGEIVLALAVVGVLWTIVLKRRYAVGAGGHLGQDRDRH